MNNYNNGGLNFLDFSTLNNTYKVNWIRHYLKTLPLFGILFNICFLSWVVLRLFYFVIIVLIGFLSLFQISIGKQFWPGPLNRCRA